MVEVLRRHGLMRHAKEVRLVSQWLTEVTLDGKDDEDLVLQVRSSGWGCDGEQMVWLLPASHPAVGAGYVVLRPPFGEPHYPKLVDGEEGAVLLEYVL